MCVDRCFFFQLSCYLIKFLLESKLEASNARSLRAKYQQDLDRTQVEEWDKRRKLIAEHTGQVAQLRAELEAAQQQQGCKCVVQ